MPTSTRRADIALALGATWAPRSVDEVEGYFRRVGAPSTPAPRPETPATSSCGAWPGVPRDRAVYSLFVAAAVGVLPGWARRELGLSVAGPLDLLVDTAAVTPLTRGLSAALRWVVTPPA